MIELPADTTLSLIITLCVILLDRVWRIPPQAHPLTLYRMLVTNLAIKVCPASSAPLTQHYISGTLGIVVLTVPFLIVLAFVLSLAEYTWFFDALILFCCINFYSIRRQYKLITLALSGNKKLLARERLTLLVARQTNSLSDIGIAKAAIEAYLLRFMQQFVGVIFWFLVAGPLAALSYRLLLEFRWQWHRKKRQFTAFGLPAYWLSQSLILIPYCLGLLLILLSTSPIGAIKGLRHTPQRGISSLLLSTFGAGMGIQLGGPAFYDGTKLRNPRVGGSRQVRFSDLTHVLRAINRQTWLVMVLLTLLLLLCWQLKL
jgi:adenosylcobinamide-phosphate synthase